MSYSKNRMVNFTLPILCLFRRSIGAENNGRKQENKRRKQARKTNTENNLNAEKQ